MATEVHADGIVGNVTLAAVSNADSYKIINSIYLNRENFYKNIVKRRPSQQIFLKGWLRRITEVKEYCLSHLE
jgi:lysozyme family protein